MRLPGRGNFFTWNFLIVAISPKFESCNGDAFNTVTFLLVKSLQFKNVRGIFF